MLRSGHQRPRWGGGVLCPNGEGAKQISSKDREGSTKGKVAGLFVCFYWSWRQQDQHHYDYRREDSSCWRAEEMGSSQPIHPQLSSTACTTEAQGGCPSDNSTVTSLTNSRDGLSILYPHYSKLPRGCRSHLILNRSAVSFWFVLDGLG